MKSLHPQILRQLRKEKGISQEEFGKKFGMSQRMYGTYEQGIRQPSIDTLLDICEYYNVSLDYITGNETKKFYTLTDEERDVLENYKKLTEKNKGKVEHYIEQLAEEQEELKVKKKKVGKKALLRARSFSEQ